MNSLLVLFVDTTIRKSSVTKRRAFYLPILSMRYEKIRKRGVSKLLMTGIWISSVLSQNKLYFPIHVLIVDRFTYLIIDATSRLKTKHDQVRHSKSSYVTFYRTCAFRKIPTVRDLPEKVSRKNGYADIDPKSPLCLTAYLLSYMPLRHYCSVRIRSSR